MVPDQLLFELLRPDATEGSLLTVLGAGSTEDLEIGSIEGCELTGLETADTEDVDLGGIVDSEPDGSGDTE